MTAVLSAVGVRVCAGETLLIMGSFRAGKSLCAPDPGWAVAVGKRHHLAATASMAWATRERRRVGTGAVLSPASRKPYMVLGSLRDPAVLPHLGRSSSSSRWQVHSSSSNLGMEPRHGRRA